jgi:hypothetical protein
MCPRKSLDRFRPAFSHSLISYIPSRPTTRFASPYTVWDSEAMVTRTCLDGSEKVFDLERHTVGAKGEGAWPGSRDTIVCGEPGQSPDACAIASRPCRSVVGLVGHWLHDSQPSRVGRHGLPGRDSSDRDWALSF